MATVKQIEPEKIEVPISTNLKPSETLRWLRMCARKGWRHTSRVRDAIIADLEKNKEPEIEDGLNVSREIEKFRKK